MRIAIATDVYLPQLSGIADSIETLAAELMRAGHEVLVTAPRIGGAVAAPHVHRLPAFAVPGSGGALQIVVPFGLTRALRAFRPDLIHVHLFGAVGWAAVSAARRIAVPVVGTDHTFPADYLRYLHLGFRPLPTLAREYAVAFYNRCQIVTAPSAAMIAELKAYGLKPPAVVVSNPIRVGLFRPLAGRAAIKRRLGIGPEAVLLFGRIAEEKNLNVAVDIFAAVVARRPASELVIIGDGPYQSALEQQIAGLGLGSQARFMGELHGEPLNEAINACDVYLITSKSETQSMTLLQASAAGLAVVAIRAGALPEYVVEGQTGFVIDKDDRAGFVDRIAGLLAEPERARNMGANARVLAEQFAPAGIAAAFTAVYDQAMAAMPARLAATPRLVV